MGGRSYPRTRRYVSAGRKSFADLQAFHSRLKRSPEVSRAVSRCSFQRKRTPMLPILRRTRHLAVAGMAAGTLLTAGLVGQLAVLGDNNPASGTTVPSAPASSASNSGAAGSSASSSASASSSTSSKSSAPTYGQVPSVNDGGNGGTDSNTRGS